MVDAIERGRARLLAVRLARNAGTCQCARATTGRLHLVVDERRPEPDGYVRPETWDAQWRTVQPHRYAGAWDQDFGAFAPSRGSRQGVLHHSLDDNEGRGPRPGHVVR